MDKVKTTPKDFFLWAGAMLALYMGIFNYIALLWDYINYALPNPLAYNYYSYNDPYQSGISWEMATLIVLTPTFLLLMWLIRRDIFRDPTRNEVWVRRWALFLTLFIAGATTLGDLIYVLYAFLNGSDITTQFLLKALVVLMVAGIGFMHFLADLWGYWAQYPVRNRYVSWATLVLVAITIVAGFFIVGTPEQARLTRFDQQKVNDLQNIQSEVVRYWQAKQKLPISLADLNDPLLYNNATIVDVQTGQSYEYKTTGNMSFQLCANFNKTTQAQMLRPYEAYQTTPAQPGIKVSDNWKHSIGRVCFDRTIDAQLYLPTKVAPVK